jgi:hypothetical protein
MKKMGMAPMVLRLALVSLGFLLISELAYPTASGAQTRGRDDVPEELWQIYPLDPTKEDAGAPQTAQVQPPPPVPQAQPNSAVRRTSEPQQAPAEPSGESDSGRSLALPLFGALLALVALLVVAAGRKSAFGIAGEHRVRGDSALGLPLRAATRAPRYVGRSSATVVSRLRTLPRPARHIGHLLVWLLRASAGVLTYVVRSAASAGQAARQASKMALHAWRASRSQLIFYALVVLVSVGLGLLIPIFLSS